MGFTSHPDVGEIIQCSGYLYYNPTTFANEAGWGTKIGYTEKENASFSIGFRTVELTSEDSGIYPVLSVFVGCIARLYANLINWNSTACGILFPSIVGGTSGTLVSLPGSLKTGTDMFGTNKVLFVPEDNTRHPALYFKNISPHMIESAVVKFIHSDRTIFPFACVAKSFQMGKLSEMTI